MKSDSFKDIVNAMNKSKISYMLANESLIGYSEGDVHKYSPNLQIYLFDYQLVKIIYLSIICFFYGITVKPKKINGVRRFKVRKRSSIFYKEGAFAWLHILKKTDKGWKVTIGNRKIEYTNKEFSPQNQTTHMINEIPVVFPADWKKLVVDAKNRLLAEYYPIQSIELSLDNESSAINLLKVTTEILEELNIPYWLEGGTLLGAVRDQKLIPWDHDLDIGIKFTTNKEISLLIRMLKKHFIVRSLTFQNDPKIWKLGKYRILKVYTKKSSFKRTSLCLDIFLYYKGYVKDKGEVYRYVVWGKNAYHSTKYFDTLNEISFYGLKVKIPSNPEKFLQIKYGTDWKTPKKKWNVVFDDGSIIR